MHETITTKKNRLSKILMLLIIVLFSYQFFSFCDAKVGYCIDVTVNNSTMSSSWSRCQSTIPLTCQTVTKITGVGNFSRYESLDGFAKIGLKELSHGNQGKLVLSDLLSASSRVDWIEINEVAINDSSTLLNKVGEDHYTIKINESIPTTVYDKQNILFQGKGIYERNNYINNDDKIVTNYYGTQLSKSVTSLGILAPQSYAFGDITPARTLETVLENRGVAFKLESNSNQYSGFGFASDTGSIEETYRGTFKLNEIITNIHSYNFSDDSEMLQDFIPCCPDASQNIQLDQLDDRDFGLNVKNVFDYTCFEAPSHAQFQRTYDSIEEKMNYINSSSNSSDSKE